MIAIASDPASLDLIERVADRHPDGAIRNNRSKFGCEEGNVRRAPSKARREGASRIVNLVGRSLRLRGHTKARSQCGLESARGFLIGKAVVRLLAGHLPSITP